jgi:hypothetical protein
MKSTRTASNGKMIKPSPVLCKIPVFSRTCTSPCTPLTSRLRRRAASLIANGPAPVIVRNNSQRFVVMTWKSNSGVAKANARALLPARECSLRTAFDFLERGDFERHSFHFSVSMLQRHSKNRLTVSRDQRIYRAFRPVRCADGRLCPLHYRNAEPKLSLRRAPTDI